MGGLVHDKPTRVRLVAMLSAEVICTAPRKIGEYMGRRRSLVGSGGCPDLLFSGRQIRDTPAGGGEQIVQVARPLTVHPRARRRKTFQGQVPPGPGRRSRDGAIAAPPDCCPACCAEAGPVAG